MHDVLRRSRLALLILAFAALAVAGNQCPTTDPQAMMELAQAGVNKYVGAFEPASVEDLGDWDKYTFDTDGGNGPTCIAGTPFTVFHQQRDPRKLAIFLNGGGACWQDFYFCSILADEDPPAASGMFADGFDTGSEFLDNPLADWSKLYVSYCDGSVHQGDNDVVDANFPFGPVRFHRGLRNVTAAIDLARSLHPAAKNVLLSGSSAGGFGVSSLAPWVTRFVFPASAELRIFNDAGPPVNNPALVGDVLARANDWGFTQFWPPSCTDCDLFGDGNEFVRWSMAHDRGVKVSTYSTDGDSVIRFFLGIPTQAAYREALLNSLDPTHADHPFRYKRFIRSGDTSHTQLRGDLYYTGTANGVPVYQWMGDFVSGAPGWVDIVEDFVPAP